MIEFLFLVLGVVVGYNIRHERNSHQQSLVLDQVDAKLRKELSVAKNLNQSLSADVAELKRQLALAKQCADSKP
jgi:cell division protein FtsB